MDRVNEREIIRKQSGVQLKGFQLPKLFLGSMHQCNRAKKQFARGNETYEQNQQKQATDVI